MDVAVFYLMNDVIEYLMAGASAVQIGSILGFEGLNSFNEILIGLYKYLQLKNYKDIIGDNRNCTKILILLGW